MYTLLSYKIGHMNICGDISYNSNIIILWKIIIITINQYHHNIAHHYCDSLPIVVALAIEMFPSSTPFSPINLTALTLILYCVDGLRFPRIYEPVKLITLTLRVVSPLL